MVRYQAGKVQNRESAQSSWLLVKTNGAVAARLASTEGGVPRPFFRELTRWFELRPPRTALRGQLKSRESCSMGWSPCPNLAIASRFRSSSP